MISGVIVIDKEQGWTSHDVVARLRGILKTRRIGHTGTLDPLATGVLPVMVGRATRAAQFLSGDEKEYTARFRTGITTDTQDITGTVLKTSPPVTDVEAVRAAASAFIGEGQQIPPMYSAVKIDGVKLYDLARKGIEIERQPRRVVFSRIEITPLGGPDYQMEVTCSKGAYIRTLCHDIGTELGCGAALTELRRTRSGPFFIEDSILLSKVHEAAENSELSKIVLPVDTIFKEAPPVNLSGDSVRLCRCGAPFRTTLPDGRYRVYDEDGEFLMLGEARSGRMYTVKSFFEP
ncbi:MAG: tRNA pseudouridine(55) synthase TruB [Clostridiales bacterium]|jgi:tRNA pseudouridine55 synthase|nr:tRNA pseudouridine(55) synthase TruB [Clostridiales bacterium]